MPKENKEIIHKAIAANLDALSQRLSQAAALATKRRTRQWKLGSKIRLSARCLNSNASYRKPKPYLAQRWSYTATIHREATMTYTDQIFEMIAKEHLDIETLKTRNSDSLDFHDCSVWGAINSPQSGEFDGEPPKAVIKDLIQQMGL